MIKMNLIECNAAYRAQHNKKLFSDLLYCAINILLFLMSPELLLSIISDK